MQTSGRKKINVLHVVSRLPVGGVETMLLNTVKHYDKESFNVSICCIKEGGAVADELVKLGYKVTILGRMKGKGLDPVAVKLIYKLIKNNNIHVLRSDQFHANLYGRVAGILAGVPAIVPAFHNLYNSPRKPKLHRRLINYILSFFTDSIIAVSDAVAADIIKYDLVDRNKVRTIYNGINTDAFKNSMPKPDARRMFGLTPDAIIIGTTGRLTEQKGHRYLIEAAAGLGPVTVVIAGDGPLRSDLQELSHRLGVNCVFIGMLHQENIPSFLASLDIFCFPSLWEGFGVSLIEAMAAGLPVVASDIPPHREVVDDNGIFVPMKSAVELEKKLRLLIEDHSLRESLGRKASERAKSFSIKNTVRSYESIFEEILTKKKLIPSPPAPSQAPGVP